MHIPIKLVYGVGFMMITFSFENDEVNGLPYFVPTIDRSKFKRNSRARYFEVEETDLGHEGDQFNPKKIKIKKRRKVKRNDWKIGNSRSMRLLASGISKKLWFWTFPMVHIKSEDLIFLSKFDMRNFIHT